MNKKAYRKERGNRAAAEMSAFGLSMALALAVSSAPALAANHALIMGIGSYAESRADLPGIDLDIKSAKNIAQSMGVPEENMVVLGDKQLSLQGMRTALDRLGKKVGRGDGVFIYYSGHGTQVPGEPGKCSEGLVAYDMQMYPDADLQKALRALSEKAGQLVMMNDSCYSGGAATKALPVPGRKAKFLKLASFKGDYQCGHALNMKFAKSLIPVAAARGANMLYVAASSDREVANATSAGSAATLAWLGCIQTGSDARRSGALNGNDLKVCAQQRINQDGFEQTISLEGNRELALAYVGSGTGPQADAAVDPSAALQAIRSSAAPNMSVSLKPAASRMKIGEDTLDFEVTSAQKGYLSVLMAGSDGESFDLLFPNDIDKNNYVDAGSTLRLPRASWRVKAGGPPGTSYLLAIVSEKPRDFKKWLDKIAGTPYYNTPANRKSLKNLVVEATGQNRNDPGRYGASEVVGIEEYGGTEPEHRQ